jgi:hypothetical protein
MPLARFDEGGSWHTARLLTETAASKCVNHGTHFQKIWMLCQSGEEWYVSIRDVSFVTLDVLSTTLLSQFFAYTRLEKS